MKKTNSSFYCEGFSSKLYKFPAKNAAIATHVNKTSMVVEGVIPITVDPTNVNTCKMQVVPGQV